MTQTDLLFDLDLGLALKREGIERASEGRSDALALGRAYAKKVALSRPDRLVSADDVTFAFVRAGLPADLLGPAAGALFKTPEFEFSGKWMPSNRTSNHGRMNRLWRLK